MSVLCKANNGRNSLFVKGAPESVLSRCTSLRLADGTTLKMNGAWERQIRAQFEEMARRPLRCLALAVKEGQLGVLDTVSKAGDVRGRAASVLGDTDNFINVEKG